MAGKRDGIRCSLFPLASVSLENSCFGGTPLKAQLVYVIRVVNRSNMTGGLPCRQASRL